MKKISKFFIFFLCLFMLSNVTVNATNVDQEETQETQPETETPSGDINIILGEGLNTPYCVYGKDVKVDLTLVNEGKDDATDVVISPVLDSSTDIFPFEIKKMNYDQKVGTLSGTTSVPKKEERTKTVSYSFTTRNDVKSGYMKVSFLISFKGQDGTLSTITKDIFVKTEGAPVPTEPPVTPDPIPTPEAPASVPRVIVSGFTTEPAEVKAGEQFNLILHITNTSSKTSVSNLEFNIESETDGADATTAAAAFLPVAGSNTIFLKSIGKEETKDISIEMTAKADLAQKPYLINLGMKFEDSKANQYTADASVSIPVKQEPRLDVSEPQVMPNSIIIGSESNVMFSIYNTGKTKLYNVSVEFLSDTVSGGNAFVGNIDPGATGNVDAMLMGQMPTMDEGIVKVNIIYEDESGNKSTIEKEISLFVSEPFIDVDGPMMPGEEFPIEEPTPSRAPMIIGIILVILIIAVVVVIVVLKRKKKMEEGMEDEIS